MPNSKASNTKARREFRHNFVRRHLEKIGELNKKWDDDMRTNGIRWKPPKDHPVRAWIYSTREEAGYSPIMEWRSIWYTLRRDYNKLKREGL